MKNYLKYLGLARKAGKTVIGQKTLLDRLKHKPRSIGVILIAADISENTGKKLQFAASSAGVPCFSAGMTEELSAAIGMNGVGIIGVTEPNLAIAICNELSHEQA